MNKKSKIKYLVSLIIFFLVVFSFIFGTFFKMVTREIPGASAEGVNYILSEDGTTLTITPQKADTTPITITITHTEKATGGNILSGSKDFTFTIIDTSGQSDNHESFHNVTSIRTEYYSWSISVGTNNIWRLYYITISFSNVLMHFLDM